MKTIERGLRMCFYVWMVIELSDLVKALNNIADALR
jgi:hypothetical protein